MNKTPNVAFVRKELKAMLPEYRMIRDCISGSAAIKAGRTRYLPQPCSLDDSAENTMRYTQYLDRSQFMGVTARTLQGLVGALFGRGTELTVPPAMDYIVSDGDGMGVPLLQVAKRAAQHVVGMGRCGLFVDYPATDGPASVADVLAAGLRPTIKVIDPEAVINWRTTTIGGREALSLVVMVEEYASADDGFELTMSRQWRVLRLVDGRYEVSLWRDADGGRVMAEGPMYPTDASGQLLDHIPFAFIGSENNDSAIDRPPLADIAALNIGHYRNSADYEESSWLCGQPTPVFTGLTEDWAQNVLKGRVQLGSRGAIPLPVGASAALLQALPNSMPFEAMQHKEAQMLALGAKLVEPGGVQKTATEARMDNASENSVLSAIGDNIGAAFTQAIQWAADFAGASGQMGLMLVSDFATNAPDAAARAQLLKEYAGGLVTFEEARAVLRDAEVATEDDEAAKVQIDEALELAIDMQAENGATIQAS